MENIDVAWRYLADFDESKMPKDTQARAGDFDLHRKMAATLRGEVRKIVVLGPEAQKNAQILVLELCRKTGVKPDHREALIILFGPAEAKQLYEFYK